MFLSLTVANFLWVWISPAVLKRGWFRWFSLGALILSLCFLVPMFNALDVDSGAGLYQRINYGISLVWLLVLTQMTMKHLLSHPGDFPTERTPR